MTRKRTRQSASRRKSLNRRDDLFNLVHFFLSLSLGLLQSFRCEHKTESVDCIIVLIVNNQRCIKEIDTFFVVVINKKKTLKDVAVCSFSLWRTANASSYSIIETKRKEMTTRTNDIDRVLTHFHGIFSISCN